MMSYNKDIIISFEEHEFIVDQQIISCEKHNKKKKVIEV